MKHGRAYFVFTVILIHPFVHFFANMFTIPKSWDAWLKTLVGGMVSGGANAVLAALGLAAGAAAGLPVHQMDAGQMMDIFVSGALIGAFMYLAKSPVPPDAGNTPTFYRSTASPPNEKDPKV